MISDNKRIVLNFAATYGRSLFALVCGLLSGRWALMALGEIDYGLYGLVGGLAAFVSFVNNLMAGAVSRFYAYAVGNGDTAKESESRYDLSRQWFSIAVMIHTVIPTVLLIVGYPIGTLAIRQFLTIPVDRIMDCMWVWRFVCMSCYFSMMSVPFVAMYTAKQEIAELTVYSIAQTAANVVFLYYIVSHEGVWMVPYAAWMCVLSVFPLIIMCVRAASKFEECKFNLKYTHDLDKIKELFVFAGCRFFGAMCIMINTQGLAILTNKFLGPVRNAAMTVGNSLSSHSENLAGALDTALSPAIANKYGAGKIDEMRTLCYKSCKFSALLMLVFALPLSLEVDEVMRLWLKTPPDYAAALCVCLLVCLVLEKITSGHWMSIFAVGRIGHYQFWAGMTGIAAILMAWILMHRNLDLLSVGCALMISKVLGVCVRLHYGRIVGGLSASYWMNRIFIPLCCLSAFSLAIGYSIVCIFPPSLLRIVLTTMAIELVFLPLSWFLVLEASERGKILSTFKRKFCGVRRMQRI